ncbi:MAG: metallophosphoesterase family protein [Roseburia sp.]|nr:metallophosphoesterase family protein [Roseburia sp.]
MGCHKRIDRALQHALHLPLCGCSRYVVISDCHRGEGTSNDNFLKNQHLYSAAMNYYVKHGFFYLELGDGEELWENRCRRRIKNCHEDVYELFDWLEKNGRIVRLYGNHNMELAGELPEAVILDNMEGGRDICMIHGHQADFFNSVCWKLSRFLVRYLWKPLERSGVNDPTSAARNYKKSVRYEKCLEEWTRQHGEYLAAGHSHRPRLPQDGGRYLNAGSCVHPGCITAIEIENMHMTLVKWKMQTHADMSLYVAREEMAPSVPIEQIKS